MDYFGIWQVYLAIGLLLLGLVFLTAASQIRTFFVGLFSLYLGVIFLVLGGVDETRKAYFGYFVCFSLFVSFGCGIYALHLYSLAFRVHQKVVNSRLLRG